MTVYDERPWTKQYDEHVSQSMAPYPDHPLHEFLRKRAQETPDRDALITTAKVPLFGRQDARITFKQLDVYSDALAAALVDQGLQKGDRVVIVMPNCTAFAISFFAVLKAGGVVAATNPTYPPAKMQYQIDDCGAEFVIVLSMFYKLIQEIRSNTR